MRSQNSITADGRGRFGPIAALFSFAAVSMLCVSTFAQRVAVLTPERSEQTEKYSSQLADALSKKLNILDSDMSHAAFVSVKAERSFNLTNSQARSIGAVTGTDAFLLVKTGTLRRSSLERDGYYESFVTVFAVNSRTGMLAYWNLKSFEAATPAASETLLFASVDKIAAGIIGHLEPVGAGGPSSAEPSIEEVPEEGSPLAKQMRPPAPYKRIKPEYTRQAYFYNVVATVDAEVDIDGSGTVTGIKIRRWAGFGLDESVIAAVRRMNWRPAERGGKTLPMRVLLRYNFTKIDKE